MRAEVGHFIYPFDPGVVTTSMTLSEIDPVIYVTCSTFTDDAFIMDGRELYSVGNDLNEMAAFIGVRAGHHFASLREPVPSNVILGDN